MWITQQATFCFQVLECLILGMHMRKEEFNILKILETTRKYTRRKEHGPSKFRLIEPYQ